ncbi:MAG: endolytic transglycosylase MltG [Patescibacteria group bacterium]
MELDFQNIRQLLETRLEQRRQNRNVWFLAILAVLLFVTSVYFLYIQSPTNFVTPAIVNVKENASLNEIAQSLYSQKVVKSAFAFRTGVIAKAGEKGVHSGDYLFKNPANLFTVISRLTKGDYQLTPVKVLFPEGVTVSQMSVILSDKLIDFDSEAFIRLGKPLEGYLFPDTYLFLPNAKPLDVIDVLKENFDSKIKTVDDLIKKFKKPVKDVVIMASILEAEARTKETRQIISGILWKRLSLGMLLQVDAPFQYIIGKNTFQLTTADLKFDSPYNTYKYKGLPPGPIGNPGLEAIIDAVTPQKTSYFYYLSDVRGNMHYAKTYEEHLLNKERFLN